MFVDRSEELAMLQRLVKRQRGGELLLLYGRRRVGKTALLRQWADQSGIPWTYWMAQKEPAELQRRNLYAAIRGRAVTPTSPTFASWSDLWDDVAEIIRDQRRILVLDELPWAVESDPATLSALQYAWDTHFQHSGLILALCGSHIRTMETLLSQQAPLFGRLTAQHRLQPLPFGVLHQFFPTWSLDALVAAYAIVGGVPQYLSWFDPAVSLSENIRHEILGPASMALAEVELLLADEVREIRTYLTILNAIGEGAHALKEIADATLTAPTNLTKYLAILQQLHLVERRVPATVPPALHHRSKQGRYHLIDPFHRFYFRFLRPNHAEIAYQPDRVLEQIQSGLRAFVGQTAWEELARLWVLRAGMQHGIPFMPEVIGSHWSRQVQTDVVAISWRERAILIGECKWTTDPVDRQVVRRLLDQTLPKTLAALPEQGVGWRVLPAIFARTGATSEAAALFQEHGGLLIDLATLATDLRA